MHPPLSLGAKVSRVSCCSICRAAVEVVGTKDSRKDIDAVNGDDADEELDGATEL